MREIYNYPFRKKTPRLFKYIQLHVYIQQINFKQTKNEALE